MPPLLPCAPISTNHKQVLNQYPLNRNRKTAVPHTNCDLLNYLTSILKKPKAYSPNRNRVTSLPKPSSQVQWCSLRLILATTADVRLFVSELGARRSSGRCGWFLSPLNRFGNSLPFGDTLVGSLLHDASIALISHGHTSLLHGKKVFASSRTPFALPFYPPCNLPKAFFVELVCPFLAPSFCTSSTNTSTSYHPFSRPFSFDVDPTLSDVPRRPSHPWEFRRGRAPPPS